MNKQELQSRLFSFDTDHVGALDGIRVIAVLIVLWFHFWQQTWLMPYYPTPFLNWIGIKYLDFNFLRRSGYLCVDLMILLSGFVLFLPYAKQRFLNTPVDSKRVFYIKRAARILPSYLFAVIVMFLVAYFSGVYANKPDFMWRDLLMHLSLTFMLRPDTYLFSGINGVFWTVVIEVLFYVIFPFIAKFFQKRPLWTYLGMTAIGLVFTFAYCLRDPSQYSFLVNRFLTFFPVFANGMAGAYLYMWFVTKAPVKPLFSVMGTILAIVGLCWLHTLFKQCSSTTAMQAWQLTNRYPLSIAYLMSVLGICVSVRPIRFLFSNRVMTSFSLITYNLYLWHQFIVVQTKLAFGCSSGADVAALGANTQWMLNTEALIIAIVIAVLTTFLMEQPVRRWILSKSVFDRHNLNNIQE